MIGGSETIKWVALVDMTKYALPATPLYRAHTKPAPDKQRYVPAWARHTEARDGALVPIASAAPAACRVPDPPTWTSEKRRACLQALS